jgi:hypothetical protein
LITKAANYVRALALLLGELTHLDFGQVALAGVLHELLIGLIRSRSSGY